jgi:DinB superfamily
MATTTSALDTIQHLTRERERIVRELSSLNEADMARPAAWGGMQRNVNFLLRAYSLHELDHLQQLNKLLRARGRHASEAQILLAKAQALRGEVSALLLGLSDEEFDAPDAGGEWSVRELVEHLAQVDQTYFASIQKAIAATPPG